MNKYYYLVASLPYLRFDEAEVPIDKKTFLDECSKWLSPGEMKILLSAGISYSEARAQDKFFVREWKTFNTHFMESLAAARAGGGANKTQVQSDLIKNILAEENPLLMEKRLEEARWNYLGDNEKYYFFDLNALIIYYLKVEILERLASFDKDKGEKFFYELCEVTEARSL